VGHIFISYSRVDKDFVDRLARDIEAVEPLDVWKDRDDIGGGVDWYEAISRAIRECSAFVLVLSPNSTDSRKVAQELSIADKHDRQIVPLTCESCEVPAGMELPLARQQTIDFTGDYDAALARLLAALGSPRPERPKPRPREEPPPRAPEPRQPEPWVPEPTQPPRAPQLNEVLPGRWQVTIIYPMTPPITLPVALGPDGSFWTQLPMGSQAQGRWAINQGNQVYMQGMESNGMITAPYTAWLTVTNFTRDQINGVGSVGEPIIWRRVG
jgi:hypothetical protein